MESVDSASVSVVIGREVEVVVNAVACIEVSSPQLLTYLTLDNDSDKLLMDRQIITTKVARMKRCSSLCDQ